MFYEEPKMYVLFLTERNIITESMEDMGYGDDSSVDFGSGSGN